MTKPEDSAAARTSIARLIDDTVALLTGRSIAVLTGAGLSTDSGIPDYRGEGAPVRTPMTFAQFLDDEAHRKRYWAGSHLGWRRFAAATPNDGHRAIARLENTGVASGVVTQNVDGLHRKAGSRNVVELHGAMDRVRCLICGRSYSREVIADEMAALNPWLDRPDSIELNPDGDVQVDDLDHFTIPECRVCGGMLKPDVVFFGEYVPLHTFALAKGLIEGADALVIAGSSLAVNSGIRLLDHAVKRSLPIVIVNRGATKGDSRATVKIDAGASETLTALAERLN